MTASKLLPTGVSARIARFSNTEYYGVIYNENGEHVNYLSARGTTRDECEANIIALYYAKAYDGRDGKHLKGTAWVNMGDTKKRVPLEEKETYVANGWKTGKGLTGPNIRTLGKPVANVVPVPALAIQFDTAAN